MSRAFQNHPLILWQIPEESKRFRHLQNIYEIAIHLGMKYGEVYATSEDLEGIAIWRPPEKVNISYWKYFKKRGFRLALKFGLRTNKRITFIKAVKDSMRNIYMKVPYWYLEIIGVDPKFQGKGFARKLLEPMLSFIDIENLPVYLEISMMKNLGFFEKFDFITLEEIIIPNTNIVNWSLIRISEH